MDEQIVSAYQRLQSIGAVMSELRVSNMRVKRALFAAGVYTKAARPLPADSPLQDAMTLHDKGHNPAKIAELLGLDEGAVFTLLNAGHYQACPICGLVLDARWTRWGADNICEDCEGEGRTFADPIGEVRIREENVTLEAAIGILGKERVRELFEASPTFAFFEDTRRNHHQTGSTHYEG